MNENNKIEYSEKELYKVLKKLFPTQNDDYSSDYSEELNELRLFGILTLEDLENMIKRNLARVLELDRSPLQKEERDVVIRIYGEDYVLKREKEGYWFSFPALLRNIMEEELGEEYIKFNTYDYDE